MDNKQIIEAMLQLYKQNKFDQLVKIRDSADIEPEKRLAANLVLQLPRDIRREPYES